MFYGASTEIIPSIKCVEQLQNVFCSPVRKLVKNIANLVIQNVNHKFMSEFAR